MADGDIDLAPDRSGANQICERLSSAEIHLATTDIEVEVGDGFKLPLDQIAALGVGFSSLPTMFRSVATTINVPTLLQATDKLGNPLDPSVLQRFSDGSGMLGSFRDAATGFGQARFHQVDPGTIQSVATMPYDPTMLFMAAALAQINQKLDAIQDTVNEMFEYMRQKDKAELRGNIKTLEDVFEAYRYNWNNDIWRKNAHMKVIDIKQESEKAIIHLRAQIRAKMGEKGLVELRFAVGGRLDKVLDRLKEYQLATYTYSFAAFLEPMLSENFDETNLNAIVAKISDHGNEYRKLYTECYNAIEESSKGSADAVALRGASAAFAGLGAFVKQTPLGERTSVDETLEKAARGVGSFNEGQTRSLMEKLQHAKAPNVLPFKQSLEAVNNLHNHPHQLAADGENVYLLPFSQTCVVADS